MKNISLSILFLMTCMVLPLAPQPSQEKQSLACSYGNFRAIHLINGGFLLAATKAGKNGGITALRLSPEGQKLWQKDIDFGRRSENFTTEKDQPVSVLELKKGGFIILGHIHTYKWDDFDRGHRVWLIRLTPDGDILWQNNYGGTTSKTGRVGAIIREDNDGSFLIAGHGFDTPQKSLNYDGMLMRISPEGKLLNQRLFPTGLPCEIRRILPASQGRHLLLGNDRLSGGVNFWVLAVNKNLDLLWSKTFGNPWQDDESYSFVHHASDRGYYIGMNYFLRGRQKSIILKTRSDTRIQWQVPVTTRGRISHNFYDVMEDKKKSLHMGGTRKQGKAAMPWKITITKNRKKTGESPEVKIPDSWIRLMRFTEAGRTISIINQRINKKRRCFVALSDENGPWRITEKFDSYRGTALQKEPGGKTFILITDSLRSDMPQMIIRLNSRGKIIKKKEIHGFDVHQQRAFFEKGSAVILGISSTFNIRKGTAVYKWKVTSF